MTLIFSRITRLLAVFGLAAIISGCAHYQVDFYLANDSYKPKGRTVAVISGTKEEHNAIIAQMVSEALGKTSKFQITPQLALKAVVQPYPQNIKGPYKSAYFQIDTDWELGDRQKIAQIQKSLGVDFLYVIWTPIAVSSNGAQIHRVPGVAQLFDSSGKVVAKTEIMLLWGVEKNIYVKEGTDEIALQMAEKMNMSTAAAKKN